MKTRGSLPKPYHAVVFLTLPGVSNGIARVTELITELM